MGMGPQAVPKLKELIHDPDEATRRAAIKPLIQALVNMHSGGVTQLIDLLDDPDPSVRFYAAQSLSLVDRKAVNRVAPRFQKLLTDDNHAVRKAAAITLAILKPPKPKFEVPGPAAK